MRRSQAKLSSKIATIKRLAIAKLDETHALRCVLLRPKKRLRFLELPGEIRAQIYNELIHLAHSSQSLTGVHSLRLVNRQIKHEFDHELVQTSIAQINRATSGRVSNSLYRIFPTDNPLPHPISKPPTQPMLTMDPLPNTYPTIQTLHLTTYIPDPHIPHTKQDLNLQFLSLLPPSVRSVTITLLVPPDMNSPHTALAGINALAPRLAHTLTWKAITTPRQPGARVGVARVEVRFPLKLQCTAVWYWECLVRLARESGLDMWLVRDKRGVVRGMGFAVVEGGSVSRRECLACWLERVWERVRVRSE
ncbi:hypothetical protein M3J09_012635 [Ascochyta lentis]